jgi:hypothetical protein
MTASAVFLLAGLFFAHFLGDFTALATPGMQAAKAVGRPIGPIAAHGLVHALLVTLVVWVMATPAFHVLVGAAVLEFSSHFCIDGLRGRLSRGRPELSDPSRGPFWMAVGLDQLAHAFVLIGVAALVL